MILRGYQLQAVQSVIARLANRPLLVMPTGGGKTVTATEIVRRVNLPTLWLAHRKELIDQAAKELESRQFAVGVIMSGSDGVRGDGLFEGGVLRPKLNVASIHTIARRNKPSAELIVIDEAHHATAESYRSVLAEYPNAMVLGLTATPFRLDGRGLGDLFGELIIAATTRQLCDAGTLHSPRVWSSKSPDLRGVKVMGGDYSVGQLAKRANDPALNADIVKTWQQHATGRRTVCFACDVEHSQTIANAFLCNGIEAEHIDGSTPKDVRDAILSRLAKGKTKIVSNCMILTEGWDLPALECAIIARPTASLNLHLQMIGRVMRACHGKDGAIVLDHAGNHHVHGLVTRPLRCSLDGSVRVGHEEPLGIKRCRQCGLMYDVGMSACPECGFTATTGSGERDHVPVNGEAALSEFDDSSFEYRRQFWQLIEAQREAQGFKEGWSYYRFQDRFGMPAVVVGGELIEASKATADHKRETYERLASVAKEKGFAAGWVSHRYKEMFGVWPKGFVGASRAKDISRRFLERAAA